MISLRDGLGVKRKTVNGPGLNNFLTGRAGPEPGNSGPCRSLPEPNQPEFAKKLSPYSDIDVMQLFEVELYAEHV